MSLSQKISQLRRKLPVELLSDFNDIADIVGRYDPDYCLERFRLEPTAERLETLKASLGRFFSPYPGQDKAFYIDRKRWFTAVAGLLAIGRLDGLDHYIGIFPRIFKETGKELCGNLRRRCDWPHDKSADRCTHKFEANDEVVCPVCGAVRWLCRQPASANGRCYKHGGRVPHGLLNGKTRPPAPDRATLILSRIKSPRLREGAAALLNDPDPLSTIPLMAPLFGRYVELIEQIDEFKPQQVERGVKAAVNRMTKALEKERYEEAISAAGEISRFLDAGKESRAAWGEIMNVSTRLQQLAEAERRNLSERQQMVSIQEMIALQQEMVQMFRDSLGLAARWVFDEVMNEVRAGRADELSADFIFTRMRSAISSKMRENDQMAQRVIEAEVVKRDSQ